MSVRALIHDGLSAIVGLGMATDLIRYDLLVQDAMRGVVRKVLSDVMRNGLPGEHHFNITFRTGAPGVRLSERMREKYPEEMTIILQHQFWDLSVTEQAVEVGLSFRNEPEMLRIPFESIIVFVDPTAGFSLEFHYDEAAAEKAAAENAPPAETPALSAVPTPEKLGALPKPALKAVDKPDEADEAAKIVSIDAFRKKP